MELTDGKYKVKLKQNTDCLLEVHDTSTGLVELSRSTDNGYYWSFVTPDDYAKYVALAGINAKITAVGTLPYADPEKKPSTYNATSASDAETHAASLTTALRAYVESNALAEGVAGRLDFTSSILEPSCVATEASGDKDTYNNGTWTCVEVRANGGEGYTNAAGTTKGFYFDSNGVFYGNTTGSRYASLTQTISNLPAGSYLLTVTARKSANLSTLNLVANGESAAITNPNGVFGNSWDDTSVEFSVGSDGQATISINADKEYDGNTGRWFSADNFRLVNLGDATVSATVGANGYTTFASPYALDLTDENRPKGLKAYKATLSGDELSFTAIDQTVPAGTGLLLLGETKGGTYNIPIVAEGDDIENDLVGVTTPTSKQSSEGGVYYFVMMKAADAESPLEFFPLSTSSEVTIPAGKAYVEYDTTSSGAKSLRVVIDGHATEVTAPAVAETEEPEILYNMAGIPVGKDFKGIVINQKGEKRFNK